MYGGVRNVLWSVKVRNWIEIRQMHGIHPFTISTGAMAMLRGGNDGLMGVT